MRSGTSAALGRRGLLVGTAAAASPAGGAVAQGTPGRPLRILCGFTPGGSVDIVAVPVGVPNLGSTPHVLVLEFARAAGARVQPVPYRGSAGGLADVMGGRLPLYVAPLPSAIAQHRAGQVQVIGATAERRVSAVPEVAALAELPGAPPSLAQEEWHGLFAPARTPAAMAEALNAAVGAALARPEVREGLARMELAPFHEGTTAFAARVRAEFAAWGPVAAASGFRPEE